MTRSSARFVFESGSEDELGLKGSASDVRGTVDVMGLGDMDGSRVKKLAVGKLTPSAVKSAAARAAKLAESMVIFSSDEEVGSGAGRMVKSTPDTLRVSRSEVDNFVASATLVWKWIRLLLWGRRALQQVLPLYLTLRQEKLCCRKNDSKMPGAGGMVLLARSLSHLSRQL